VKALTAEDIRALLMAEGAVKVGFAPVERFAGAPIGHRPEDFLPTAKSVIAWAVRVPTGVVDYDHYLAKAEDFPQDIRLEILHNNVYGRLGYSTLNMMLDQMTIRLLWELERSGYRAVGFPATYNEYHGAQSEIKRSGYRAPFSHRHAAVAAGLGEFGLNNILVTEEYGPWVRVSSLITDLELPASPLVDKPICLRDGCRLCLEGCVAIEIVEEDLDQIFLHYFYRTDPRKCREEPGCLTRGSCLRACPLGR